jgi:3-oxoacid CoA-transferase B subunit
MTVKERIAFRVAKEITSAKTVNLGAGLPSFGINYLPKENPSLIHAEHGILGVGPDDPSLPRDIYRCDASVRPVTIIPGGSIVDSSTSFGLIRGGHLDVTVLGVMQVDEEGSLANWMVAGGAHGGNGRRHGFSDGSAQSDRRHRTLRKGWKSKNIEKVYLSFDRRKMRGHNCYGACSNRRNPRRATPP